MSKKIELECKFGFESCANKQKSMCEQCEEGDNYEITQEDIIYKKETALEFFFQQVSEVLGFDSDVYENIEKIFQIAKQMEKEQIEVAYVQSMKDNMIAPLDFEVYKPEAEEYYQETYGNG